MPLCQVWYDTLRALIPALGLAAMFSRSEAAHQAMETLMQSGNHESRTELILRWIAQRREQGFKQGREEGFQQGFQKGRCEGELSALFEVLDARGLKVNASARQRILACTEPAQLKGWLRKAVTVDSVQDLFERQPAYKPAPHKGGKRGQGMKAPKPRSKR